ncbi:MULTISPECIES: ABC transporter ATP-binding protein [Bacillus]|uniref:Peptide ABC transporter ATPase n=2 Tax=Bacillus TaxID=1386 RepID=A0A0M5JAE3_9BACI|nr:MULTISPECIES: ABC transporter ATP-binding protein [Bacillus]ALC82551.1 peptide ABC transporter ATPase [Bacillus gobiensis]MBP1081464.1 oligopeptide/dipeptide ABC transporter ATP-binding protein [Bacillus capparidis]MED1096133.1 ABC transporter ATP-binding protein [Bacillus capparidis]
MSTAPKTIMDIKNISIHFSTENGIVKAVNDISFRIKEGETVCIVGESGCGKSVTAMTLMGLIDEATGKVMSGEVWFNGQDLLKARKREMNRLRGNDIAMIFQEPMSSLNPVLKIGHQIEEAILEHRQISRKNAKKLVLELIELVGIPGTKKIAESYPHQLSGGMLQRIMIAIALSCNPKLLIADEPTTALDVTIQAQILELLKKVNEEKNTSILLITHDLGVVAEVADYVVVMYAGKIVEQASVYELFKNPQHPYTKGLLKSKPVINQRKDRLYSIPGQVPNLTNVDGFCLFSDRCEYCMPVCREKQPALKKTKVGHQVACWLQEEETG